MEGISLVIIDLLVGWIVTGFGWLVNLLPGSDIDLPVVAAAWGQLSALNYFLPISETVSVVVAAMALGPAFLAYSLAQWITVGVIRGGASKV